LGERVQEALAYAGNSIGSPDSNFQRSIVERMSESARLLLSGPTLRNSLIMRGQNLFSETDLDHVSNNAASDVDARRLFYLPSLWSFAQTTRRLRSVRQPMLIAFSRPIYQKFVCGEDKPK
jgi:hypothetical protein